MSRWTDEELRELVTLWPTNSASEIANRLPACARRYAGRQCGCAKWDCCRPIFPSIPTSTRQSGRGGAETNHGRGATTIRRRQPRDSAVPNPRDRLIPLSPAPRKGQRNCPDDQCDRNRLATAPRAAVKAE